MSTPEETLDLVVQGLRRTLMHAGNGLSLGHELSQVLEATLTNLENLLRFYESRLDGDAPVLILQRSTTIQEAEARQRHAMTLGSALCQRMAPPAGIVDFTTEAFHYFVDREENGAAYEVWVRLLGHDDPSDELRQAQVRQHFGAPDGEPAG
jgi:hypothetical protein